MRHTHIKFSRKLQIFAAYSPLAPRAYVASPETAQVLAQHMAAEETQDALAAWIRDGQADADQAAMVSQLRDMMQADDQEYTLALKAYRRRHLA